MPRKPDTLLVDVDRIASLQYDCVGCHDRAACCCGHYDVCVSAGELSRMEGFLPEASRYTARLRRGRTFDNVFERNETGLYDVDTDEDGLCVFAYRCRSGVRCSLHSAALKRQVSVVDVKPAACLLWPLSISSGSHRILTVQEGVYSFPCNRRRTRRTPPLCAGIAEVIDMMFGTDARMRIEAAVRRGRRTARITVQGRPAGSEALRG